MERMSRKPFQGVVNIVRFNRHFYILAIIAFCLLIAVSCFVPPLFATIILWATMLMVAGTIISLAVSWYVYDHSNLYKLDWLNDVNPLPGSVIYNIHAGFDETSSLLANRYPAATLTAFDFYDPVKHTEPAIIRARKAYAPYPGTQSIDTLGPEFAPASVDIIFTILAAHEIRSIAERIMFFKELKEALKPGGKIVVVEHLRDLPNFLAYNIGFFHFFSLTEWRFTFSAAELSTVKEKSITPFIRFFILQ